LSTIVHSVDAIEAMLRRGLTPRTDNRDALVALGFERASPLLCGGYGESVWERSFERSERTPSGERVFVRERALLERHVA